MAWLNLRLLVLPYDMAHDWSAERMHAYLTVLYPCKLSACADIDAVILHPFLRRSMTTVPPVSNCQKCPG